MTNYTIQSGDNLWNIAKNTYGENLKSNADIQKAVDAISKNNNIKNPDVISIGSNLNLPDITSIFETAQSAQTESATGESQEQKASAAQNDDSLFQELNEWQGEHQVLMEKVINGEVSFDDYENMKELTGSSFDFMDGKDYNNEEEYNNQTLELAQGELMAKDSNNDEQVSFNEYFSHEMGLEIENVKTLIKNGEISKDDAVSYIKDAYILAQKLYNVIDQKMGNGDNYIDAEEFQTFYQYLDEFDNEGKDGKFDIDAMSEYPEFLANQIKISPESEENAQKIATELLDLE